MSPLQDPKHGHCKKCNSNSRIVVYRRNGGKPEWLCAICTGQYVPDRRERR
jgi:hypothetical protein